MSGTHQRTWQQYHVGHLLITVQLDSAATGRKLERHQELAGVTRRLISLADSVRLPVTWAVSDPAHSAATSLILLMMTGGTWAQVQQTRHWSGQGLAPVYEGFDINDDGSYNMWFGYMNRNFEEELEVPIGAENKFEPGPADRGQPTHFDTRRHKDVFRVVVPKDFGDTNKLVWTVTVRVLDCGAAGCVLTCDQANPPAAPAATTSSP